jgi:uncharacterized protein
LPIWISLHLRVLLEGSGVFIGALLSIYFLNKYKQIEISFFGIAKGKAILISIIPIFLLTVIGVKNDYGLNSNIYGFIVAIGSLIYCIMEEYGWRGYLQEEFGSIKPLKRYVFIGFIWYVWHLSFLTEATFFENLFFLVMLILGSWGIGQIADSTKSILISACFHLLINILMFNSLIKDGIDGTQKFIILSVSFLIWILILRNRKKEFRLTNNE